MKTSRIMPIYATLFACFVICFPDVLYAQDPVTYNRDKSLAELTLPASPEATSVTRYADVPFTHSSGMAELSIPVYTLQGKELSIPISLSYRSGGIRVSEVAGSVGLGWSLQAGGCITREVIFLPDEYKYNGRALYQQPSGGMLDSLVNDVSCTATREYLTSILWNQKDCSSDRYSYNVCGLSGSFVFTPSGEIVHLSGDGCLIQEHRDSNGKIDYFTLTGPDGSVFVLSAVERGYRNNVDFNPTPMSGAQVDWNAPTAWYVSSITSADGLETATFSYSTAGTWVCNTESTTYTWTATTQANGVTYTGHHGPALNTDSREHDVIVLTSIRLSETTVYFTYAAESGHADYAVSGHIPMNNYPRRLTGIRVSAPGHQSLLSMDVSTAHGDDGRIVLDSLILKRNGFLDDRWTFTYEPSTVTNYYGQDWFGYPSGESTRSNLVPYTFPAGNGAPVLSYGFPAPVYAKGGMLKRADHDGAVTEFEYEGNAVGSGNTASSIGVRVKQIKVYDGEALVRVRSFTYDDPIATAGYYPVRSDYTTSRVDQRFEYHPLHPNVIQHVLYDWTFTLHDSPVAEGVSLASSRVIYGHVTEEDRADSLGTGVSQRTEYWFGTGGACSTTYTIGRFPSEWSSTYTQPSFINYVPSSYCEQHDRGVGLLTRKEEWRYVGEGGTPYAVNGYEMAQSEDWTYTYPESSSVLTGYTVHQVMYRVTAPGGDVRYEDLYHYPVWSTTQPDMSGSTVTRVAYHEHGNDTMVVSTLYAPRPSLTAPNRILSVSTSVGTRSRNIGYTYPDTWGSPMPRWVDALKEGHRLLQPIRQTFYYGEQGRSGLTPFILDRWKSVVTQYDSTLAGGALRLMPVRRIETTGEGGYESWREEYLSRDRAGNVREIKERGRPRTVILWGYYGQYPVAVVENASLQEVISAYGSAAGLDSLTLASAPSASQFQRLGNLRSLLPQAHVTTYTYDPGIGITSATSPSGKKDVFEYDTAGRLSVVKDSGGNPVEGYTYSLLNQGDDRRSVRHRLYRASSGTSYSEDVSWWNTLGMHTQDIAEGASGDGRDLVSAYEGDFMLHDDVRSWLPYPVQGSGGAFQAGAAASSATFHGSVKAYTAKGYEVSGRDKVVSGALPGYAGTHETTISEDVYRGMASGMPVLEWENGSVVDRGVYSSDELVEESTVDADGRRVSVARDHAGRTLAVSHGPAAHTPTVILDGGIGQDPIVSGDPLPTLYVYDRHDQLRAVIGSGIGRSDTLNMWRYGYDTLGRLASKGIPGAAREYYGYDGEDRLVSISRGSELIENVYDAFGRVTEVYLTASNGPRTLLEEHCYDSYPDSAAALLSIAVPYGSWSGPTKGLETWSRLAQIDGDGNVDGYCSTVMLYDHKERLVGRTARFPDGVVANETYVLNFPGEVIETVTSVTRGSLADTLTVSYQYDLRGRVTSATTTLIPDGASPVSVTTQYGYDALGRASGWTSSPAGIGVITLSQASSYTLQGWIASNTVSKGVYTVLDESLHYSGTGLPSGATPSYTGLVAARSMVFQNPGSTLLPEVERYTYDHAARLTAVSGSAMNVSYSYDGRGNLLSAEEHPLTGGLNQEYDVYTYSYSGDRLTSVGQDHYSPGWHSHIPQITHVGDWSFTHDTFGRMISDGLDGELIDYNYMGLPRKVGGSLGNMTYYSYLAGGMKTCATLLSTGAGLVYRGPMVYKVSGNGALTLDGVSFGEGRLTPGGVRYHVCDRLGSVKAVVDGSTGAFYSALDYSEYGTASASSSVSTSTAPSGETFRTRFTGHEDQGPDFGLPYTDFGARHYSSSLRRWLTPDPMSEKYYDISPYAYCANNPVNLVDPEGRYYVDSNDEKTATRIQRKAERRAKWMDFLGKVSRFFNDQDSANEFSARASQLHKTSDDINKMRDSNSGFHFEAYNEENSRKNELVSPSTKRTGYDKDGNPVYTMFTEGEGNLVHEIRHGGQIARGESFDDIISIEVDAYKAQFGWDGKISYPSAMSFKEIKINQPFEILILVQSTIRTINHYDSINRDFVNDIIYFNPETFQYHYLYRNDKL